MKVTLLIFILFIPVFTTCMEDATHKKSQQFTHWYETYRKKAMEELPKEDCKAFGIEAYKVNRKRAHQALQAFAKITVNLAFAGKEKSEEKLTKKTMEYALFLIDLRDASLGLKSITVTNELTAKAVAISRLTSEEQAALQPHIYQENKEKTKRALMAFAQNTASELEAKNLLLGSKEDYQYTFYEEKVKEFEEMSSRLK